MITIHSSAALFAALPIILASIPARAYVGPTLNAAGAQYLDCVRGQVAKAPAMQAALLDQLQGAQTAISPAWQSPTWQRQNALVAKRCGRAPAIAMWDNEGADNPAFPDAVRTAELMMLFSKRVARIEKGFVWLPTEPFALQVGTD